MPRQAKHFQVLLLIEILPVFPLVEKSWIWDKERLIRELWILKMFLCQKRYPCMLCALTILLISKCSFLVHHDIVDTIDTIRICTEKRPCRFIVKSLNQKIVTGGDKLGHPFYNWLTMHPNEYKKGVLPQWGGTLTVGNFSLPVNDIWFENIKREILYAL